MDHLAGRRELAGDLIDLERNDRIRGLILGEEVFPRRIDVEVSRCLAPGRNDFNQGQLSSGLIDREHGDRIVPAIGTGGVMGLIGLIEVISLGGNVLLNASSYQKSDSLYDNWPSFLSDRSR